MDLKQLYKKADLSAGEFVKNVKAEDLDKQSTCSEWTVRDLLNHMVGETLWLPELLAGKTIEQVGDKYDGDVIGDDPVTAWEQASLEAQGAVEDLQNLDQITHLSYADVPAFEYLSQMIFDKLIHGWDVAKSTSQEDTLDPELVDWVYQTYAPQQEMMREHKVVGDAVEVPEDADKQTKLLAILGRKR